MRLLFLPCIALAAPLLLSACMTTSAPAPEPEVVTAQCGIAAWYSMPGARTASGERMNPSEMTAAHRTLPFGTEVDVTNLANGETVTVVINDRGPYGGGRIIDLSRGAANEIDMVRSGTAQVRITVDEDDAALPGCR